MSFIDRIAPYVNSILDSVDWDNVNFFWVTVGLFIIPLISCGILLIWSKISYDYNVFNTLVILRIVVAIGLCFIIPSFWWVFLSIALIWNFIETLKYTNIFIALLGIILQPASVFFVFAALNKISKLLDD